jgi:hypothetical protein
MTVDDIFKGITKLSLDELNELETKVKQSVIKKINKNNSTLKNDPAFIDFADGLNGIKQIKNNYKFSFNIPVELEAKLILDNFKNSVIYDWCDDGNEAVDSAISFTAKLGKNNFPRHIQNDIKHGLTEFFENACSEVLDITKETNNLKKELTNFVDNLLSKKEVLKEKYSNISGDFLKIQLNAYNKPKTKKPAKKTKKG